MLNLKEIEKTATRFRRHFFESLGSERYSRPYRRGVGRKLEKYLPDNGFFIEAGATDGFSESNTYFFERFKGWTGILVEPIPPLYEQCVKERPRSKVFNCALVANDFPETEVEMIYGHLMSVVKGSRDSREAETEHAAVAGRKLGFNPYAVRVPARTLTSILDEQNVKKIDFFALDVEGFEMNVLKGLDFNKYRPKYIMVECLTEELREEISSYLSTYYNFVEPFSKIDFFFESKE